MQSVTLFFSLKRKQDKVVPLFVACFRRPGRYMSCGENHGVKPPNPEQYLTPLQQKEVTVRHLKTKLKESERRLHERCYASPVRWGRKQFLFSIK